MLSWYAELAEALPNPHRIINLQPTSYNLKPKKYEIAF